MDTTPLSPGRGSRALLSRGWVVAFLTASITVALAQDAAPPREVRTPISSDRLMVVDCVLPGQVLQLGRAVFQGPRHAVRTTVDDCELRGGEHVAYDRSNYATSLQVWLPEAEHGDPQAQIYVGELYENGLGTTPDYAVAAQWYEKAAKQNSQEGMIHLAALYEQGRGVSRDPVRALNLYRTAAGIKTDELTFASEVTTADARIEELTDELEDRTEALSNSTRQLDQIHERLATLQAEATRNKRAAEALRLKVAQLEARPADASNGQDLAMLRKQLSDSEQQVAEQDGQIARLEQSSAQQNTALGQEVADVERQNSALKAQLGSAQIESATATSQLAAAKARQSALEQESARLRAAAEQQEQALRRTEDALHQQAAQSASKAQADSSLSADAVASRMEAVRQREIARGLDAERDRLAVEVARLQSQLGAMQSQVQAAGQAQQKSVSSANALLAQLASLQSELLQKNRQIDALSAGMQADEKQIAADRVQLTQQLAQTARQRGADDAEARRLNALIEQRETAIRSEHAQREELTAALTTANDQIVALSKQVSSAQQPSQKSVSEANRLATQLTSLQSELLDKNRQISSLSAGMQADEKQIAADRVQLTQQLSQTASQRGADDAEVKRLNALIEQRETAVRSEQAKREELTAALNAAKDQVVALTKQVSDAQAPLQKSVTETNRVSAQLAGLQSELQQKNRLVSSLSIGIQANEKQIAADRVQLAQQLSQTATQREAADAEVKRLNTLLEQRETAIRSEQAQREGFTAALTADRNQIAALSRQLGSVRGPALAQPPSPPPAQPVSYVRPSDLGLGANYALIIADAQYQNSSDYDALPAVARDAAGVKTALLRYGFNGHIQPLRENPSRDEIMNAVSQLVKQVGPNDSVLIYYAGHGTRVDDKTYWLPSDAKADDPATWVSTSWVSDMILMMQARHVLLVVDSCYAGAMVHAEDMRLVSKSPAAANDRSRDLDDRIKLLAKLRSRTVMTSGGNEPVLSNGPGGSSIFARQFIDALDRNTRVLDASALYDSLADRVTEAAAAIVSLDPGRRPQRPHYSVLVNAGHQNGDFLFVPAPAPDSHT